MKQINYTIGLLIAIAILTLLAIFGIEAGKLIIRKSAVANDQVKSELWRKTEQVAVWRKAASQGAPIFRDDSCSMVDWCADFPALPSKLAIKHIQHGFALATNDVQEFGRWYGVVSYPPSRKDLFQNVSYVYESIGAKFEKNQAGTITVSVTLHEKRQGGDAQGLPSYERTYDVTPDRLSVNPDYLSKEASQAWRV